MKNNKKEFDDFETLMVYLNESNNQQLNDDLLSSKQGCKQLEGLQNDMNAIENKINDYQIDEDYGSELWNKISDRLDERPKSSWIQKVLGQILQPQFSIVGFAAMFAIAITFYLVGHNQAAVEIKSHKTANQQLLSQNMQLHLAQTDMFLTQVSNMSSQQNSPVLIKTAESLLASNRIYKNAYTNNNNKRLKILLTELEQVLLEVSNGDSNNSHNYISEYATKQLLYKVKSSNQQLKSQLSGQKITSI